MTEDTKLTYTIEEGDFCRGILFKSEFGNFFIPKGVILQLEALLPQAVIDLNAAILHDVEEGVRILTKRLADAKAKLESLR